MKVRVEPVHFRIEGASEGLRIVIPRKWSWGIFLALPVELSLFVSILYEVFKIWISAMFASGSTAPKAIVTFMLVVWFVAFGQAVSPWLWNLGGRHILILNDSELSLRRELFGLGRTEVLDANRVSNWRYVPEVPRRRQPALPAGFAFDFAGKEVRAGRTMEEAEVKQLFAQIRRRFPSAPWAPPAHPGR